MPPAQLQLTEYTRVPSRKAQPNMGQALGAVIVCHLPGSLLQIKIATSCVYVACLEKLHAIYLESQRDNVHAMSFAS